MLQGSTRDRSRRRNTRLPAGVAAEGQRMSKGHSAPGRAGSIEGRGSGLPSGLIRAARCGTEQEGAVTALKPPVWSQISQQGIV